MTSDQDRDSGGSIKKRTITLACVLLFVGVGIASGQAPAKPGPEHEALGIWVGTWKAEGKNVAGDAIGKTSSEITCEWFAGRFQVVCRVKETDPLGSFTFEAVLAYSPVEGVPLETPGTKGKWMGVSVRQGAEWSIVASQSMVPLPPPT